MSQNESKEKGFGIEVENLFDDEKRKIKVKHKKESSEETWDIDYPDSKGEKKNRRRFNLSSKDHLEIELGEMVVSEEPDENPHWIIKLPFVADFKFLSESGKEVPLIYEVARNESTGGRTVVYIPTEIDPTACKLIIAPPGRLKENYQLQKNSQLQNLSGELAASAQGITEGDFVIVGDNVSIGDNKPG